MFMAISKTISEVDWFFAYMFVKYLYFSYVNFQVTWSGPNIVVFNDVTITPPYKLDNVTGNPDSRQLTYVKKIVSSHYIYEYEIKNSFNTIISGRKIHK